ncbi:Nramp family divalent metal transporter [Spongiivirga citrea]|uniref:Divalent metal cation transporter n=1 Tax=Spongiivirga citrea TaxID=1481457 RepID=A0A6M0CL58_9FLAO|nr:Nramp family divalent metal transporter [Spongiivirga citrea]NER18382.1 divalent metal cation transporter [Spongiivirga citrea]
MINQLKKLGPGLLFAGAAIGVSHLVQSTRAGADFGFGLIWALLLVNLFKYPFFQFGPRYAMATGESLLDGYKKLGRPTLIAYALLTLGTMFTIQTAVTIVTAGIAVNLFGFGNPVLWSVIITCICMAILLIGKYKLLDSAIKVIIITLTISTIIAVAAALIKNDSPISVTQIFPAEEAGIIFLIAFMGWMPAPLDISIWHSLWAVEKKKDQSDFSPKNALFDFNLGYIATVILGIGFVSLGALVMYGSGETFSDKGGVFAGQLINLYTENLGSGLYIVIAIAAFTTMFSTTLTTLDASPRAMNKAISLLSNKSFKKGYLFWIVVLAGGTSVILSLFLSDLLVLVKIATVLSFITAPFYAIVNFILISGKHTPKEWRPSLLIKVLSYSGIAFLIGFSIWYTTTI